MKPALLALALLRVPAAWAHHSLAAEFDSTKPITLTGTVVQLDWRNPHAWLYVDVKGDSELYHGISITETFSVDAHEQGPLIFGFYVEGRMSWFATDRDMSVSGSNARGRFTFVSSLNDPEPIQYQLVGGVSVRFDPRRRSHESTTQ